MGKKDKEHRKKITIRNQRLKAHEGAIQKLFKESMLTQMQELKKKYDEESGTTENQQ